MVDNVMCLVNKTALRKGVLESLVKLPSVQKVYVEIAQGGKELKAVVNDKPTQYKYIQNHVFSHVCNSSYS